jgi:septum formation protein
MHKEGENMRRIVLASGSPRRKELLEQIGLEFEVIVSNEEEQVTSNIPSDIVKELSLLKAKSVFDKLSGDVVVIGADTVVSVNDSILGKPANEEGAFLMLESIAGREHRVFTGVTICIREKGHEEIVNYAEGTTVFVQDMTTQEILDYIACGESLDKAGAYGIQGRFAAFIKGIEGDYNNVVGLPVGSLAYELRKRNIL